jgi:hypothetical protein
VSLESNWGSTRVHPKYSGPMPPSTQQLWEREAPLDGRTTMSSKSVCHVARSWVDVGSFHTRFFWSRVFRYRPSPGISGCTVVDGPNLTLCLYVCSKPAAGHICISCLSVLAAIVCMCCLLLSTFSLPN